MRSQRLGKIGGLLVRATALIVAVLLVYAAPSASGDLRTPPSADPTPIEIAATPLAAFDVRDPSRRQFGALEFRGGLVLSSSAHEFGGLSAIRVAQDGQQFLAVTDKGYWLRGRIRYENGRPIGIADAELAPMLGPDGRPITLRRWYDAESLATDGRVAYVGLERVHQILKFDIGPHGLSARGRPIPVPTELRRLPANKGIEGLLLGPPGTALARTLIAFSERGLDDNGNIRAFLLRGRNFGTFSLTRSLDFDITDADATERELFILERRFSFLGGPGMRIRRAPIAALQPGALVDGRLVIEANAGHQIDNMEGLSVHRGPQGEIVLTLVSDDNFSVLQRTLLLQFILAEP